MAIQILTADEAVKLIENGKTICTEGFVGAAHPEELCRAVEKRFLETGEPKDLTLVYAAGQGGDGFGVDCLGHEGLLRRTISGHWNHAKHIQKLAMENKMEAYNLPQGVIAQLYRDMAGKRPGMLSRIGLNTFVDPRIAGGKINDITKEDIVHLMEIGGEEYLFYESLKLDYCLLRGTYADELGNITMEHEGCNMGIYNTAAAVKANGGKVIVQVEKVVQAGTLDARLVKIPGILVDVVVVCTEPETMHMQTYGTKYNPAFSGECKVPVKDPDPMPLNVRKVICRRAAMELVPNAIVNLGIGMPEDVATVAAEEGISSSMTLTVESGPVGGVPQAAPDFGVALNPQAIVEPAGLFDFYDGGGLDLAFLGLAECDKTGDINVSKFGPRIAGAGGFINITQSAKSVVFCGTFTAAGLKLNIGDGKISVVEEGKVRKFVEAVQQITFSGKNARKNGQKVLYVTERAVFELTEDGLLLTEVAPGMDLEKDILGQMDFEVKVSPDLKQMDARIFTDAPMGLTI